MNYSEIQTMSYGYYDATGVEVISMYDNFLRITESKINRHLKTLEATSRVGINAIDGQEFYGLPADFNGMRNIQINGTAPNSSDVTVTAEFRTPAQLNELKNSSYILTGAGVYYTIVNDQIQLVPNLKDRVIELVYYRKTPPMNSGNDTNWVGNEYPDAYVFGVLVEIASFNKDAESATLWESRFNTVLSEIISNDVDVRWNSGTQLVMQTV